MQFNGLTPLGTNLNKKVIQPFLAAGVNGHNLAKPILVRSNVAACLLIAPRLLQVCCVILPLMKQDICLHCTATVARGIVADIVVRWS